MSVRVQKNIYAVIAGIASTGAFTGASFASVQSAVQLKATPEIIAADGRSFTTITAIARGGDGNPVPDGTLISFTTNLGQLDHASAATASGEAHVILTSTQSSGTAEVTATYLDSSGGGIGQGKCTVEFTKDSDIASTDANSRWLRVDCSEYLVYSADAKMIQAEGKLAKKSPARLRFKGLTIEADSLQVDIQAMSVIARNAVMKHGRSTLAVAELQYDLFTSTGTAVLPATDKMAPQSVTVTGATFDTVPLSPAAADAAVRTHLYGETDLSSSRLVVSARAVSVDPGTQIQFTRAAIYSDGKKIVSMPFHVMPLSTNQLFGEQIVGYSSQGLFLNIPYYYHVTPDSMGTIYIRNSAATSAGITSALAPTFGSGSARPGLAVDLQHTYSVGSAGSGTFVLNGLTRSDWGAYWNHTQRIDPHTASYLYVDYPEHRGIFGTSNIRRDLPKGYTLSMTANENVNPGFDGGGSSQSSMLDTFVSGPSRRIGKSPLNMTPTINWSEGFISQSTVSMSSSTRVSTQAATLNFFTNPTHPDKKTVVTNSFSIGGSYSALSHQTSETIQGVVGATRTLTSRGQVSLSYNYTYDPLFAYSQPVSTIGVITPPNSPLQQTISLSGNYKPSTRSMFNMSANYALPIGSMSMFGFYNYQLTNAMGLSLNGVIQHTYYGSFSSLELSVTRRILNRTIAFTYGTDTHRLRFDFGAGQF